MKKTLPIIPALTLILFSATAFAKICSTSDYSSKQDPYSAVYTIEVADDLSALKLSYRIGLTQFTIDEVFNVTQRENGDRKLIAVKGEKALSLIAKNENQATFFMIAKGAKQGFSGPMTCKY